LGRSKKRKVEAESESWGVMSGSKRSLTFALWRRKKEPIRSEKEGATRFDSTGWIKRSKVPPFILGERGRGKKWGSRRGVFWVVVRPISKSEM